MNKNQALALLQQQRRFWRSRESDAALACRAERVFLRIAVVYFLFAPVFLAVARTPAHLGFYGLAGEFLICGLYLFWRSRRFTQVLRILSETERSEVA